MGCLGNIIWLICGGFVSSICWLGLGLLWCLTIVGIPIGKQCFKFAKLSFCPFGKEVFTDKNISLIRKYGVCALVMGICVISLSTSIIADNSIGDALSDGINALGEGLFALLMGEIFSIGLKLKKS